jgi:hypothetical protein
VTTVRYRLVSRNPYDTFADDAEWRGRLGQWDVHLRNGELEATPTEQAEVAELEAHLRDWAAAAYLSGRYDIYFRPAEEGEQEPADETDEAALYRRQSADYPAPDEEFVLTSLADELVGLIGRYRAGEVSLPTAGRLLLDRLEAAATGPASTAFNVDPRVIDTLAELTGRAEPAADGRRAASYRGPEWQWMQEALRRLALQAGRASRGRPVQGLALDDFEAEL